MAATSEWVVAALGALIVAGALGYMGWYTLAYEQTPPVLEVEVTSIAPHGDRHLVAFKVTNNGNATAASVHVGGELRWDGEKVEEAEATVDYVPSHSSREGGLIFSRDPTRHELVLEAKGWAKP